MHQHLSRGGVSAQTEKAVESFLEREATEAMHEVREDEPLLAEELWVEVVELELWAV